MQSVTDNVKKSVQDVAYIAVGVSVLGAQQAQSRVAGAQAKLGESARDAKSSLEALAGEVRDRVEPVVAKIEERIEPLVGDLEARVEPVVDQVRLKARDIAAVGTQRAQVWLGRSPATPVA
jgi:hypothetical protein